MALLVLKESRFFLDEIADDITSISLQEERKAFGNFAKEVGAQAILKMINAGIKANGDMSKLVKINGMIQHVEDLNWLEILQMRMENKIREYNRKLKDEKTGKLSRIWTNIKKFLLKIINFITSAINKLVSGGKLAYKAAKNVASGRLTDFSDIPSAAHQIKDPNVRYKIASRTGALIRKYGKDKETADDAKFYMGI